MGPGPAAVGGVALMLGGGAAAAAAAPARATPAAAMPKVAVCTRDDYLYENPKCENGEREW